MRSSGTCARRSRSPTRRRCASPSAGARLDPDETDTVASTLDDILPRPPLGSPFKVHVTGAVADRRSGTPDTADPAAAADLEGTCARRSTTTATPSCAWRREDDGAEVAIFAYGSVARSAKAVVKQPRAMGARVGLVRPITALALPHGGRRAHGRTGAHGDRFRDEHPPDRLEVSSGQGRAKVVDYRRVRRQADHAEEILELVKPEFHYHRCGGMNREATQPWSTSTGSRRSRPATPSCRASSRTPRRRSRRICAPPRRSGARAAPTAPSPGAHRRRPGPGARPSARSWSWPASAAAAASARTSTTPPCTRRTDGRSRSRRASRPPTLARRSSSPWATGTAPPSRQSPHPRGAAQRRPDRARLQQLHLRHDRRPDEPDDARGRQVDDQRVRQRRAGVRPLRAGACRGSHLRRPRHLLGLPAARQRHRRRHRPPRLLDGRGHGHLPYLLRPGSTSRPTRPSSCSARRSTRCRPHKYDEGETRSHDRYPVGLLHHREREEYVTALRGLRERAQEQGDD